MTWVELLLAFVKIMIVILFLLNCAAIATWADRRQSAMVQDRVGPNRAVVELPSMIARFLVIFPPTVLGGIALRAAILKRFSDPQVALGYTAMSLQLAILVGWVSAVAIAASARKSGETRGFAGWLGESDPRSIFFFGLGLHAIAFGAMRFVPVSEVVLVARISCAVCAAVFFASGIYAAARVPEGGVPIRLAGMLHAGADAIKLIFKEDFVPKNADKLLHALAPMLAIFPALVTFAVIPFGQQLCFGGDARRPFDFADLGATAPSMPAHDFVCQGHGTTLQIADLNVGILYLFAIAGTGVVGAAIAGWSSDNKFSLLGGLRAASQMVSYEVAMGLSLVPVFMVYGGVRLSQMVEWQGENAWGIFVQPFAFILFIVALAAETKRTPFDAPEGESEIVAGYFLEYSGMKFGMFYTGEYVELITSSALLVTLFFGGWQLPFVHRDGITIAFGDALLFKYRIDHVALVVISMLAFFGKTILMTWLQIFFRWTLPRFRYDQLMKLGWTKLLPLAIANMLVTGVVLLGIDSGPAGLKTALALAADVSQGVIALAAGAAIVALVVGILEPVERERFLKSTANRFAAAAGGTKVSPQQA